MENEPTTCARKSHRSNMPGRETTGAGNEELREPARQEARSRESLLVYHSHHQLSSFLHEHVSI